jgi:hypothetical protein
MKPKFTRHEGKGSKSEVLPNNRTVSRLTSGDTWERSINNYAKVTPSGNTDAPDVMEMSQVKY